MKVALVIGHDVDNQGAYGASGMSEYEFNYELIAEMYALGLLPVKHEYLLMYRDPNIKGYRKQMIQLHDRIDNWGAEVSIEFHFNSFRNPSANGNEVLYCSKGGKKIADVFDEALDVLPNRDRGVKKVSKKDRGGGFCCRGKSKAIIVEPFFGVNQADYLYYGGLRMVLMEAYQTALERI